MEGERAFARTAATLRGDGTRAWIPALVAAVVVLVGWIAWSFVAEVSVYVASEVGRLEAAAQPHRVDAPVSGTVDEVLVGLGDEVAEGELLVVLEAGDEELRLAEEEARLRGFHVELAAVEAELEAELEAAEQESQAEAAALAEARTRDREARAEADSAEAEATRLKSLYGDGFVAESEYQRAVDRSRRLRAEATASAEALARLGFEQAARRSQRRARLENLQRQMSVVSGQIGQREVAVDRLRRQLENRRIRSPVGGTIGAMPQLRAGTVVQEGELLATVIPPGELAIVAGFSPADAVGRIQPGQPGLMHLDGFPSVQYGAIPSRVVHVASEVEGGLIEVELVPTGTPRGPVPRQHGITGRVEIEVERVTPAILVLRAAGKWVTGDGASASRAAEER